jgi:hypothetical protein
VDPEELTGLEKYNYDQKMGITPSYYYHEKARRDRVPEGYVNRSRARPTEKEAYHQQLVDYEQKAIENGVRTWDEISEETQKIMEERLPPETIANLKAAKNSIMDEGLKIVAEGLLFQTGCTTIEIRQFTASKLVDGEEVKKIAREYRARKITQGDAINQLEKMVRDAINPGGEAPQQIPGEIGLATEAAPLEEVSQTPQGEFLANDPTRQCAGDPGSSQFIEKEENMKPVKIEKLEEKMETETEAKLSKKPRYEFTEEVQRLIVGMLILDPSVWPEVRELVKPEYFENALRADIVAVVRNFYDKYHRPPTFDECLQELDYFLKDAEARGHPCPDGLHLNELIEIFDLSLGADFSYVHDQAREFARSDAMKAAFRKGLDRLQNGRDYEAIVKDVVAAASLGNGKDKEGLDDVVASDVEEKPVEWLWQDTLPKAALSVIVGMPSSGKSWFSMMVAARVSSGRPFPTHEGVPVEQGQVLILQSEDNLAETCKRRLSQEGADMSQVYFVRGVRRKDATRPVDLSADLEALRQRIHELGNMRLIIVDPLDAYVGITKHIDPHRGRDVRLALRPLEIFIEQEKVAVLGVMHFNKAQMSVIHRISGSAAWAQVPRAIWAIVRKQSNPDVHQFLSVKSNTVRDTDRRQSEFCFRISEEQDRMELIPDEEPGDVNEEFAPRVPEDAAGRRTKVAEAQEVLRALRAQAEAGDIILVTDVTSSCNFGAGTWKTARDREGWESYQLRNHRGWAWRPKASVIA